MPASQGSVLERELDGESRWGGPSRERTRSKMGVFCAF